MPDDLFDRLSSTAVRVPYTCGSTRCRVKLPASFYGGRDVARSNPLHRRVRTENGPCFLPGTQLCTSSCQEAVQNTRSSRLLILEVVNRYYCCTRI